MMEEDAPPPPERTFVERTRTEGGIPLFILATWTSPEGPPPAAGDAPPLATNVDLVITDGAGRAWRGATSHAEYSLSVEDPVAWHRTAREVLATPADGPVLIGPLPPSDVDGDFELRWSFKMGLDVDVSLCCYLTEDASAQGACRQQVRRGGGDGGSGADALGAPKRCSCPPRRRST